MKMFDADKTRMIGLPYGGKTMTIYYIIYFVYICIFATTTMLNKDEYIKPFSSNPGTSRTDRQTDMPYQYRAPLC